MHLLCTAPPTTATLQQKQQQRHLCGNGFYGRTIDATGERAKVSGANGDEANNWGVGVFKTYRWTWCAEKTMNNFNGIVVKIRRKKGNQNKIMNEYLQFLKTFFSQVCQLKDWKLTQKTTINQRSEFKFKIGQNLKSKQTSKRKKLEIWHGQLRHD